MDQIRFLHRVWYIGTGNMSPKTALNHIETIKGLIKEAMDKGMSMDGQETGYARGRIIDIYIPCPGNFESRCDVKMIDL